LIRLAKAKRIPKDEISKILKQPAKSRFRTGEPRKYVDLLKGKFDVNEVLRVERKDDVHSISNKWADWSSITIASLLEEGKRDTLAKLIHRLIGLVNGLSTDIQSRLIMHLKDAWQALDASGLPYYDNVWIQLTKFIEQIDIEGAQGRLDSEMVARLRP
jgi:hypothetical protein